MKKVCVTTWYGSINYGTNLQAYALCAYLNSAGYDARLLRKLSHYENYLTHPGIVWKKASLKIRRKVERIMQGKESELRISLKKDLEKQKNKFDIFCSELPYLDVTSRDEWIKVCSEYLAFFTGSDQVWNPHFVTPQMLLDFVNDKRIKKIAYAPSIGVTSISAADRIIYRKYLTRYDAISVREESARKVIQDLVDLEVQVVCDPTMLLTKEQWEVFSSKAAVFESQKEKYILCYFVGERATYWEYVKKIKQCTGLKVLVIPMSDDSLKCGYDVLYESGPYEFVNLIKNAEIICTDSFHATVISIIFKKDFYVLKRFQDESKNSQNDRLYNILREYGLTECLVDDESIFKRNQLNYLNATKRLEANREKGRKFIRYSLEGK